MSENIKKTPKSTGGDTAHMLVRAGLSAIPVVGGPATEIFSAIVNPPLSKRRDKWIESIVDELVKLQEKVEGFSIDSLSQNDVFITTVTHATQIAIRTHQKEKLEVLKNIVLNVASGNSPDEDLQLMFLDYVDTLTSWHLRFLQLFQDPRVYIIKETGSYSEMTMGGVSSLFRFVFPEIANNRIFYEQIMRDLYNKGLINTDHSVLHTTMTGRGIVEKRTTEIGDQFLNFIKNP
ncbi:MAG: hypothetical protein WC410_02565 [Candidatus Paceibacterota bacterium]|jgi:hypothetical protein